jgi:hypothetical protein
MGLDGNAAFAFKVHVVKCLSLHFSIRNGSGGLEKAVCKGAFTVIDMGNNAKIANVIHRQQK